MNYGKNKQNQFVTKRHSNTGIASKKIMTDKELESKIKEEFRKPDVKFETLIAERRNSYKKRTEKILRQPQKKCSDNITYPAESS